MKSPTIEEVADKKLQLFWTGSISRSQAMINAMTEWADEFAIKFGLFINENWLYFDTHVGLWRKSEDSSWGYKTHAQILKLFKKENP